MHAAHVTERELIRIATQAAKFSRAVRHGQLNDLYRCGGIFLVGLHWFGEASFKASITWFRTFKVVKNSSLNSIIGKRKIKLGAAKRASPRACERVRANARVLQCIVYASVCDALLKGRDTVTKSSIWGFRMRAPRLRATFLSLLLRLSTRRGLPFLASPDLLPLCLVCRAKRTGKVPHIYTC